MLEVVGVLAITSLVRMMLLLQLHLPLLLLLKPQPS